MRQLDDQSADLIYLDPHSTLRQPTTNHATKMDAGLRSSGGAFSNSWVWGEAADRLSSYENAVGKKAHYAICGLHQRQIQSLATQVLQSSR